MGMVRQNINKRDIFVACLVLLLGIILFVSAQSIKPGAGMGKGADFMPKLLSFMLLICGLLLLIDALVKEAPVHAAGASLRCDQIIGFLKAFAILFIYIYLMDKIGFLIMSAAYIFLQSWIITPPGRHRPVRLAVISILVSSITYSVFVYGLQLMLPAGILG